MTASGSRLLIRSIEEGDRLAVLDLCRRMLRESPYAFLGCDDGKLESCFNAYVADRENRMVAHVRQYLPRYVPLLGELERAALLYREAKQYRAAVAGENSEHMLAALRRLRDFPLNLPAPRSPDEFREQLVWRLRDLFPEKAALVEDLKKSTR